MKYYLLSHALGFDRLFDSIEELSEYVWAKTESKHLNIEFIQAHLQEHALYKFSSWGIDIAIFKTPSIEERPIILPLDTQGSNREEDIST